MMRGGRSKLKGPGREKERRRARRRSGRGHEAFGTTRARKLLTGKLTRNFKRRNGSLISNVSSAGRDARQEFSNEKTYSVRSCSRTIT
jgi:hypothetical protein